MFTRIGGILIVFLGLFQLGIFDFNFLQKERKLNINLENKKMNPMLALMMGFTFSFAWTPCIGPALSSVLIMASGATTSFTGNMLVFLYAVGFLVPFLLLGLFTTQVLNFLKAKQKLLKYTIKTGGVILVLMGIMTFTGWLNGVSSYLNSISTQNIESDTKDSVTDENTNATVTEDNSTSENKTTNEDEESKIPAYDFTLTDQYGNEHTLSDYKGKVVFLNFWATWCPPCKQEMPHIEELYQEYNLNQDDVIFLGVTNPKSDAYPNNQDDEKDTITSFLETNEYTFPTVFDETGDLFQNYNISAFPTTFMIDKEGNIAGYVPGMMTKDIMQNVINQVVALTE
jgi:cytochrome c-type biogenesis protein